MYPECIENSKLVQILNSKTLNFKLEDFLNLKEIKKISENKEEILKSLSEINFLSEEKESDKASSFSLKIEENIKIFSILNIPQKMKKEEILDHFKINPENLLRIYKKSLFWYVVLNSEAEGEKLKSGLEKCSFVKKNFLIFF